MSISAEALLDSVLKLPSEDRARIAAELIASLDGIPEARVEAAWDAEVERASSRWIRARSNSSTGVPSRPRSHRL